MKLTTAWRKTIRSFVPDEHKSTGWSPPWYALGGSSTDFTFAGRKSHNGYVNNAIVHACVRLIARSATTVPWQVFDAQQELEYGNEVYDALQHPNKRQSAAEFLEEIYAHLQLSGDAYVLRLSGASGLVELQSLRPDRVRIEVDKSGWPSAYLYKCGQDQVRYLVDDQGNSDVLHLRLFHPTDDHHGMAPLKVAESAIEVHNAASEWNRHLLHNAARPSGAMIYSNNQSNLMSSEQFDRLKHELVDAYQGAANAGRPLLLEGGLDWKQMSMSPLDMDFIRTKDLASREIALAFGVPPMMLGIPGDNTYSNYAEANRSLWRQTILPMISSVTSDFTQWFRQISPEKNLRISYDIGSVDALSADRERQWNRIGQATFLTDNEKRQALGWAPLEDGEAVNDPR